MNFNQESNIRQAIDAIARDSSLTPFQKKMRARPLIEFAHKRVGALRVELDLLNQQKDKSLRFISAIEDMRDAWGFDFENDAMWPRDVSEKQSLQANDVSRLHKLAEAIDGDDVLHEEEAKLDRFPRDTQTFLVSTEWGSLADIEDGAEYRLPYDKCAFEFRIQGRTVIAVMGQDETERPRGSVFYEAACGDWLSLGGIEDTYWLKQVRGLCVMLDAEVVETQVHSAPHKLNEKREKAGKVPLFDFRVVDLSRKHRTSSQAALTQGHKKRLHFCRGHWRHYEKHKTWIRWCLKGDPSLGMIAKEYKI